MMGGMDTVVIILYGVALINIGLGLFVYAHNFRQETNRIFAITCFSIAGWTLTNALFQTTGSVASAILWAKLSYLSALILTASFLHFSWIYPLSGKTAPQQKRWLWCLALLLCLLPLVPGLVIETVDLTEGRRIITNAGLYPLALFLFGTLGMALLRFWQNYRRTRGNARAQLRYVLAGAALTITCGLSTNLVLPLLGNYQFVWLGPASSLCFVSFTVYSIVAHKLFDIRLLIKRTLVYTLLLGILIAAYSVVVLFLSGILQQMSNAALRPFTANLLGALGIGFGVEPLRRWLERATDSVLFRREHEEQRVLSSLTLALLNVVGLDEVLDVLLQALKQEYHLQHATAYVFQSGVEELTLRRLRQLGYSSSAKLFPNEPDNFISYFLQHRDMLLLGTGGHNTPKQATTQRPLADNTVQASELSAAQARRVEAKLHDLHIALAVPLWQKEELVGLLLLGEKGSGQRYDADDMALMEMIGTQALSAIQKATYYEGDQKKSEFVSIASHELLTPITAIEGYASMILDDGMGQVDEQARNYLGKIATSSHRLSTLVKDLLSVSRIEAGRLKIEPQAIDIEKLLGDVVDQFRFMAQEKGLRLQLQKPSQAMPLAWADPDRVMQVLVNLVSNGIKYTPQGSVTVTAQVLYGPHPQVQVTVADTGLGMSPEAQSHLFEKFYRIATPETSTTSGTGLGLYITKALVEKMNGSLTLESTSGQGSAFHLSLPVAPAQVE
jgi:signal transduction histidine kinase